MSLRLRLTLILGAAFLVLWTAAAGWMLHDLRDRLARALDERLAASAGMVAGLVAQLPQPLAAEGRLPPFTAERAGVPEGMACQVASLRGEILARSDAAVGRALDAGDSGFRDQTIDGRPWRTFTLVRGDFRITTADRVDERVELERATLLAAALPVTLALLGSLGLVWFAAGRGLAPLETIRRALATRSADSLEPLKSERLPAELKPLVEAQNRLLRRIADSFERERRLTGDAAHELRSPLTAIKTHLQVARLTGRAAADAALAQAEQGADRLQRTLEQLLLLARVEGRQSFDDGSRVTVGDAVCSAIADSVDAARIDLRLRDRGAVEVLAGPGVLGATALRNLLDNALRHAPAGTRVQLDVATDVGRVSFVVRDRGPGVPPDDLPSLTQRFWRRGAGGGAGLGLAIVHAICEQCGGSLGFENLGGGFAARLELPLAPTSSRFTPSAADGSRGP